MGKGTKSQREQNAKGENSLEVIITPMSKGTKKGAQELGPTEYIAIKQCKTNSLDPGNHQYPCGHGRLLHSIGP
jgi:hypothetical protein